MTSLDGAVARASVALGRSLRERGLNVGIDEELLLCRAVALIDPSSHEELYWACRGIFVRSPLAVAAFDDVFERLWAGIPLATVDSSPEHGEADQRMLGAQRGGDSLPQFRTGGRAGSLIGGESRRAVHEVPGAGGEERGARTRRGVLAAYSNQDSLTDHERLDYRSEELRAVRLLADELRSRAPQRRSRRARPSRRRGLLDVRRTLRRSLGTEGEPLRPVFCSPSLRPRRLVFLCDVSGSMERHSRLLLASLSAAVAAGIRAEAFAFATRLTRLTGKLSDRDIARGLEQARASVPDWSGGTRIGQALHHFNRHFAGRGFARQAVVVVVSDGWDRGDPTLLQAELARLQMQCRRLVWLNPRPHHDLQGQPMAVGMRAAMPFIDDFIPGHDPAAVVALARLVGGLGTGRPIRRQRPLSSASGNGA